MHDLTVKEIALCAATGIIATGTVDNWALQYGMALSLTVGLLFFIVWIKSDLRR